MSSLFHEMQSTNKGGKEDLHQSIQVADYSDEGNNSRVPVYSRVTNW